MQPHRDFHIGIIITVMCAYLSIAIFIDYYYVHIIWKTKALAAGATLSWLYENSFITALKLWITDVNNIISVIIGIGTNLIRRRV